MKDPRAFPDAQTAADWAASCKPLSAAGLIPAPAPWQREAMAALVEPDPPQLLGLPLVIDRNVPPSGVMLWGARPGAPLQQIGGVFLLVDDQGDLSD